MARTKQAKQKTIVFEQFKTLEEMIDTMEARPLNAAFADQQENLSSQRDETEKPRKWYGTNTYNDAMEVLRVGYKEPLEKMKKGILKIGEMDNYKRPRTQNDFVGFAPNVPNALMNLPMNMINRHKQPAKAKTIHITYNFCALADVSANQLIQGGINFISLVNSLEKQGYRVKIDITCVAVTSNTAAGFTVNVKQYGQQLNLLKLAFPLVHPSMLRRLSFKWLETTPNLKDKGYNNGYGSTLGANMRDDGRKEQKYMIENGMLNKNENSYYCNVYEAIKSKSIEELAQTMGLN